MDSSQAANAPRSIKVGARTFKVSALTRSEWGTLQAWLKDNATDPVTEVYREFAKAERTGITIASDARREALLEARERNLFWPPSVASSGWWGLMAQTPGGDEECMRVILSKHQPMTLEESGDVVREMPQEQCNEVVALALGVELPPKQTGPATAKPRRKAKSRA